MSHSTLKANLLFVPLFVWMIDISIWAIATYPSPNLTTVNWQQIRVDVGLGERWGRNFLDTDIDPVWTWYSFTKEIRNSRD